MRFPAFGRLETTFPRPRIRYLQPARLSFLLALGTLRPRSFGTLQAARFFGALTRATGGANGGGTDPGAVSIRPTLLPRNSVNHKAPSGPFVMSDGSLPGVGTGKWWVIAPALVIRPIVFAPASVNHSAPSRPTAIADGSLLVPRYSVISPLVVIRPIWSLVDSVNQSAQPGPGVMPEGSLSAVGTG